MSKQSRPNSFENFFSEPFRYDDGYGYAVSANNEREATDKIVSCLSYTYEGYVDSYDRLQRLKREIRESMKECWVTWQGFVDEDGEFSNGWVITSKWMGGKRGYKMVYSSDYDRHYVEKGHRYEPKADEEGHRVNYSFNKYSCDVCRQIDELREGTKIG